MTGISQTQLLWSDANQPAPARPYVGLRRRTFVPFGFDASVTSEVLTSTTLDVTASSEGETATLVLNKLRVSHTLTFGQSAGDARNILLAQIAASFEPVIATANGATAIDVVGKGSQALAIELVEGLALVDETLEYLRYSQGMRRAIVRVSLFGFSTDGADLDESADEYADALISSLLDPKSDGSKLLQRNSVGVENQANISAQNVSVNLPGPSGIREERVIFDVQFNAAAYRFYPANPINSAVPPGVEVLGVL